MKKNFNEKKLERHLSYIDTQIEEYEQLLDELEQEEEKQAAEKKLAERKEKQD